ncbi:MAG: sugar phosphate isomerase/epimerase family protein, partial [Planctomycetota bacterium]
VAAPHQAAGLPVLSGIAVNWDELPGAWAYLQDEAAWDASDLQAAIDAKAALASEAGAAYVVLYWGPADSLAQLRRLAVICNAIGERLASHDLRFCYHNHDHEFKTVFAGVRAHDHLLAASDPQLVHFQLDLGWVRYGGEEPAACIRRLAGRVPSVHLRDVACLSQRGAFAIPGTGMLDMAAIWQACRESAVDWIIFEPHQVDGLSAMEVNLAAALNLRSLGLLADPAGSCAGSVGSGG